MASKHPRRLIAEAIARKTLHLSDDSALARAVAAYLVQENRTEELPLILRDVMVLRKQQGVIEAEVVSAFPLSTTDHEAVAGLVKKAYPHAKSVRLHEKLQPDMLGGIKIVMPDEQLDLSVRHTLTKFKHAAVSGKE